MKRLLLAALLLIAMGAAAKQDRDIERLRHRFQAEATAGTVDEGRVRQLMETLLPDGTWPDINYVDTSRLAFQHTRHLANLVSMALAYEKDGSPLKRNKALKKKIDLALGHWLEKDYLCENWWSNQIGTPTTMVRLLYIMDGDLDRAQAEKMLSIAGRANMDASGARPSGDRARIASILAQTLLWKRDAVRLAQVLKIIEGEVRFAGETSSAAPADGGAHPDYFPGGEGLERDYSFHHRPDRVNNTTSYGVSFLESILEWADKAFDTRYRFSDRSTHVLVDFFLDGICKQMVYGTMVDPGVRNRDIARPEPRTGREEHTPLRGDPSMAEKLLKAGGGYRQAELEEIVAARKGDHSHTPSFARFFWQTEHFVFQRPGFYTSVRMFSSRNRNMEEPYNGEGLTNHYRADGTNYLSVVGDEYTDIYPVYDFRKIPGATIMQAPAMPPEKEIQKSGLTDFVGGVTDGLYGAAAFDFISPHDPLRARKSWFFFDDLYVCLGSRIESRGADPVFTTLNQCYLQGDVTVGTRDGACVAPRGVHTFGPVLWVLHDGVGYAFLEAPEEVGLSNTAVSGNWQRLNRKKTISRATVEEDVFSLWINHGAEVAGGHYAYAVLPGADAAKMASFPAHPSVVILSNTEDLQAVAHPGLGLGFAVFYSGGTIRLGKASLTCDTPLMVMVRVRGGQVDGITVSDPSRKLLKAHFSFTGRFRTTNGKARTTYDSATGQTVVEVELPQGEYAGESVTL